MPSQSSQFLGSMPITPLFFKMSVPVIFGLMMNGLYNVVDAAFVSRGLGPNAMAALGVSFPLQMLLIALTSLVGVGVAAIISRTLGEKKPELAASYAGTAVVVGLLIGFASAALGIWLLDDLLIEIGATPKVLPYAHDYMAPLVLCSGLGLVTFILSDILRAEGKANLMMVMIVTTAVLNIILDPVFIFWLGFGIKGAAYATILSQIIALTLGVSFYVRGKTLLTFMPSFRIRLAKDIVMTGLPTMVTNVGVALIIGIANVAIVQSGLENVDTLLAAYGIVGRVMSFTILPIVGMTIGFQTICGYNFGAQQYVRVLKVLRTALLVSTVYSFCFAFLMLFLPNVLTLVFTSDSTVASYSANIFGYIGVAFTFIGFPFIGMSLFQAIAKPNQALLLSFLRVYVFSIPLLFILPMYFGIQGVWASLMMSDLMAAVVTVILVYREYQILKKKESASVLA